MQYDDMMGDDVLGDDVLGDDVGDDVLGNDQILVGDDILGASELVVGDDVLGDDVLGDDVLGDDVLGNNDVGFRFRRRRRRQPQQRPGTQPQQARRAQITPQQLAAIQRNAIIAAKKAQKSKVYVRTPPRTSRTQPLGFYMRAIPPNSPQLLMARPQEVFAVRRLSIPTSVAPNFMIIDLKIGRSSQFVGGDPQSAETYKDTSTVDNLTLNTCKAGQDIQLLVLNTSDIAQDFKATLFGDVVE